MNRKEKQAQTRTALIEAATRMFAERGIAATSIDDIADEAGYTKGAFYANFASKEDIYLALLDERFSAELQRIDEALAGVDEPTTEAREAASAFMGFALSDPRWPRLFFEFTMYAARNDAFRQRLAQRYGELHTRIAELYRRWSAAFPAPPPIPLDAITTMTFCMASGFIAEQIIHPDIDSDIYPSMLEVFFRGVAAMAMEQAEASAAH